MKTSVLLFLLVFPILNGTAQEVLFANDSHVVSLFFPSPIRQAVTGAEHFTFSYNRDSGQHFGLLQANKGSDSNLLVLTEDGRAYAYDLAYSKQLLKTHRFVRREESIGKETQTKVFPDSLALDSINQTQTTNQRNLENELMLKGAKYVLDRKTGTLKTKRRDGLKLRLQELFYHGDRVFMELEIQNRSEIDFELDNLEIYLVNGRKGKRSSHQKSELKPIFTYQHPDIVRVGQRKGLVYVLPKFTLGDSEKLFVELHEKKGNRMIRLLYR